MNKFVVNDAVMYLGEKALVADVRPQYLLYFDDGYPKWVSGPHASAVVAREIVGYLLRDEDGIVFGERKSDGDLTWGDRDEVDPTHREYIIAEKTVSEKLGGENQTLTVVKVTRKVK